MPNHFSLFNRFFDNVQRFAGKQKGRQDTLLHLFLLFMEAKQLSKVLTFGKKWLQKATFLVVLVSETINDENVKEQASPYSEKQKLVVLRSA